MDPNAVDVRCKKLGREVPEVPVECSECGKVMIYYGYILVGVTTSQKGEKVIVSVINSKNFERAFYQKVEDEKLVGGMVEEPARKNFERFVTT